MRISNSELAAGTLGSPQEKIEQTEYHFAAAQAESALSSSMPHCERSITPVEKFTEYSLDYSNPKARGKAEAYERGLGFTKENAEELIRQVHEAVTSGAVHPYEVSQSDFGYKYKFRIPITGPNGSTKNVIAVYQIDNGSSIPRMITNYLEGR